MDCPAQASGGIRSRSKTHWLWLERCWPMHKTHSLLHELPCSWSQTYKDTKIIWSYKKLNQVLKRTLMRNLIALVVIGNPRVYPNRNPIQHKADLLTQRRQDVLDPERPLTISRSKKMTGEEKDRWGRSDGCCFVQRPGHQG